MTNRSLCVHRHSPQTAHPTDEERQVDEVLCQADEQRARVLRHFHSYTQRLKSPSNCAGALCELIYYGDMDAGEAYEHVKAYGLFKNRDKSFFVRCLNEAFRRLALQGITQADLHKKHESLAGLRRWRHYQRVIRQQERERQVDEAEKRAIEQLGRSDRCGLLLTLMDRTNGHCLCLKTRCGSWSGCDFCRAWNKRLWRKHLTAIIQNMVGSAYTWCGPVSEFRAVRARIKRRAEAKRVPGNYRRIAGPGRTFFVISDVDFTGSETRTLTDAVADVTKAINSIPDSEERPVAGCRAWQLPRDWKRKEDELKLERIGVFGKDLVYFVKCLEKIGARIKRRPAGESAFVGTRFSFELPKKYQGRVPLENLRKCMTGEMDFPQDPEELLEPCIDVECHLVCLAVRRGGEFDLMDEVGLQLAGTG